MRTDLAPFAPAADDSPDAGGPPAPARGDSAPRTRRRHLTEVALAALLAAGLGSGTTLAATGALTPTDSAEDRSVATAATAVADTGGSAEAVDWSSVAASVSPSVVAISVTGAAGEGEGSGVVWDEAGHVVTNNHVVSGLGAGATIAVQIGAQHSYEATVVGTDPTTDLAVIRLTDPPADLTPITRATPGSAAVGDPVMALGNPLGLSGTVTTGIVSALDRPTSTQAVDPQADPGTPFTPASATTDQVVTNAIQTSAAINPGNSGGALVDAAGLLIGINSSIASMPSATGAQSGSIGIGFAIPVAEVETVVAQLLDGGTVAHAALGISTADAQVVQGASTVRGAGVREVSPGSAAEQAGLGQGDLITGLNGTAVTSAESLIGLVRAQEAGAVVSLTVIEEGGGEEQAVEVTLGTQPTA